MSDFFEAELARAQQERADRFAAASAKQREMEAARLDLFAAAKRSVDLQRQRGDPPISAPLAQASNPIPRVTSRNFRLKGDLRRSEKLEAREDVRQARQLAQLPRVDLWKVLNVVGFVDSRPGDSPEARFVGGDIAGNLYSYYDFSVGDGRHRTQVRVARQDQYDVQSHYTVDTYRSLISGMAAYLVEQGLA